MPLKEFAEHADELLKAEGASMALFEAARYELTTRVTQLPPGPRPFVGRDPELEELGQLLLNDEPFRVSLFQEEAASRGEPSSEETLFRRRC